MPWGRDIFIGFYSALLAEARGWGLFERLEAGDVVTPAEIRRLIADAKAEQKRLDEAQKRLEEEQRRNEEEAVGEIATAAGEDDGSKKKETEAPTIDGVVNGIGSIPQDNTAKRDSAKVRGDRVAGEPVAIEGADAEPAQTDTPARDTVGPAVASDRTDGLEDGGSADQLIAPPAPAQGTADGPEPMPHSMGGTVDAAAGSELPGSESCSQKRNEPADLEEAPELPPLEAEEPAVKQGELPLLLPVSAQRAGADEAPIRSDQPAREEPITASPEAVDLSPAVNDLSDEHEQPTVPVDEQWSSTDFDSFIEVACRFVDFFRPTPNADELSRLLAFYDFETRGNMVVIGTSFYIGTPPRQKIDALQINRDYALRFDRTITVIRDKAGLRVAGRPSGYYEHRDE